MVVSLNPQVKISPAISFKKDDKSLSSSSSSSSDSSQTSVLTPTEAKPEGKKMTGFFAKIAYAWINLSEGTKGVLKGIIGGVAVGTTVAALDYVISGIKKLANKELTFSNLKQTLKPSKMMSKTGKILAPVAAGTVLVGNLIAARLTANKRTANVDHQLYEGHRDK